MFEVNTLADIGMGICKRCGKRMILKPGQKCCPACTRAEGLTPRIRLKYLGVLRDKTTEHDLEEMAQFEHLDYAIESWGDGETAWVYHVEVIK